MRTQCFLYPLWELCLIFCKYFYEDHNDFFKYKTFRMGAVLYGIFHTHSHGLGSHMHSHQNQDNINIRAASAHVIGDFLQSVGVLTAAILIKIFPEAEIADPVCTIIFSIVAIWVTLKVGRDSLMFLLEASPVNNKDLIRAFKSLPGVQHVHSMHTWSLAPAKEALTVHLAVGKYFFSNF